MSPPALATTFALWRYGARFKEIRLLWAAVLLSAGFIAWLVALRHAPLAHVLLHAAIGASSWFVLEYLIHRFVLHFPNRWFAKLLGPGAKRGAGWNVHWQHHLAPSDPVLVFTPWWALVLLLAGTAGFGSLPEGVVSSAGATFGMSAIVLFYETTHLAAHVPYKPRTRWFQRMKRYHQLHHFQNERYWFGVTHPLGDFIARTWPDPKAIERSSTARTLGVDAP